MTENQKPQKPEWFAMAEQDQAPSSPSHRSAKRIPFVALAATGLILTAGAVFANVNEEESANAENVAVVASDQSAPGTAPATDTQADTSVPSAAEPKVAAPHKNSVPPTTQNGGTTGGMVNPESNGQKFQPRERREFDDEEGEEGEHHFRGDRPRHHEDDDDRRSSTSGGAAGGIPSTGN